MKSYLETEIQDLGVGVWLLVLSLQLTLVVGLTDWVRQAIRLGQFG